MPSKPITKDDLAALGEGLRATIRENSRDLLHHQTESLEPVRQELREINTKLGAIMSGEILVTRPQLRRLLEKLNAHGVPIDEADVFAS